MSCFLVPAATIDVLVNAAAEYGCSTKGRGPRELGQLLWGENCASYRYRYRYEYSLDDQGHDPGHEAAGEDYILTTTEAPLHPLGVIKAANCYAYQSCEHPGWTDSDARAFVHALVDAAESRLPADQVLTVRRFGMTGKRYQFGRLYDRMPAWPVEDIEALAMHCWAEDGPVVQTARKRGEA